MMAAVVCPPCHSKPVSGRLRQRVWLKGVVGVPSILDPGPGLPMSHAPPNVVQTSPRSQKIAGQDPDGRREGLQGVEIGGNDGMLSPQRVA